MRAGMAKGLLSGRLANSTWETARLGPDAPATLAGQASAARAAVGERMAPPPSGATASQPAAPPTGPCLRPT